jgi:DNA-binding LytR/AlgR family response regulator
LKALIIDDEPLAHDIITKYAEDIPFLDIVGHCHLATEAFGFLNENEVDLILLDIQKPKLKGNDFLKTLTSKPFVIITSAYENYALESYELDVTDYLLKPFRFDRFLKAVNKVYAQHQLNSGSQKQVDSPEQNSTSNDTVQQILIKVDKRHLQLDTKAICYLESYGNYVKVWLKDRYHLTPRTLSSFETQLEGEDFIRSHKSFIINREQINFFEGNRIIMKNGAEVPIGKSYKQFFKEGFS